MRPFSEACERNRDPILGVLRRLLAERASVLEIGSGTGQHAVYFAAALPHLSWFASDLPRNHAGIVEWMNEAQLPNLQGPLTLDVDQNEWPVTQVDAVFSANTAHIMSTRSVENMLTGVFKALRPGGCFILYGPFNYAGKFTSESNARFDEWLKAQAPEMGVRDFEWLCEAAQAQGLFLTEDNPMPANNRLLVFLKSD